MATKKAVDTDDGIVLQIPGVHLSSFSVKFQTSDQQYNVLTTLKLVGEYPRELQAQLTPGQFICYDAEGHVLRGFSHTSLVASVKNALLKFYPVAAVRKARSLPLLVLHGADISAFSVSETDGSLFISFSVLIREGLAELAAYVASEKSLNADLSIMGGQLTLFSTANEEDQDEDGNPLQTEIDKALATENAQSQESSSQESTPEGEQTEAPAKRRRK